MNRKTFLKTSLVAGAAATLPRWSFGAAKGSDKIKVALVGCGGRGTGALQNMISSDQNIEIIALGDLYKARTDAITEKTIAYIEKNFPNKSKEIWKVTPETTFLGMDAIDKVLQTDADLVALVTPPCFRTAQIEKALNAGKHVFAEKPICIDAFQLRKVYNELIPLADKKGLNVLCGTQMRYHPLIKEAMQRVHDGQIGEIVAGTFLRYEGKFLTGWYGSGDLKPQDVEYQLRNWLAFRWTSGDQFVEQYIHNLDIALWAFNEKPIEVIGTGGRSLGLPEIGDRFSNMTATYEFANGANLFASCRQEDGVNGCQTFKIIGTKGTLKSGFGRQFITGEKPWESAKQWRHALWCEHDYMFGALREGKHINTMKSCADSCYAAIAARESAYSGRRLKCEWVSKKSKHSMVPADIRLGDTKTVEPVPSPLTYKLI